MTDFHLCHDCLSLCRAARPFGVFVPVMQQEKVVISDLAVSGNGYCMSRSRLGECSETQVLYKGCALLPAQRKIAVLLIVEGRLFKCFAMNMLL